MNNLKQFKTEEAVKLLKKVFTFEDDVQAAHYQRGLS